MFFGGLLRNLLRFQVKNLTNLEKGAIIELEACVFASFGFMSKLFATYLMNTNNIEPDVLSGVFDNASSSITGKYLSYAKMFEFKVLDFYSYLSDRSNPYFYYVRISELDLIRMFKIDSYSDDEKNELYYHKLLTVYEQEDLDDDVYWGISLLQYFYHLSKKTIKDMKTAVHLFKLHRIPTKTVELKKRTLHSKGGRKLGSYGEVIEQNIDNADGIIRNCVEKDRFVEYMDLSRDLIKVHKRFETGAEISLTGAKWKFYILRYKWKLENGYVSHDLEYEKKLCEYNNKYLIFDNLSF